MRRIGGSVSTHAMVEPSVGGVNAASGLGEPSKNRGVTAWELCQNGPKNVSCCTMPSALDFRRENLVQREHDQYISIGRDSAIVTIAIA
jgi:hypothetical protein